MAVRCAHGAFVSNTTDGGTATLTAPSATLAQPTFLWTETGSPVAADRASFQFQYDDTQGSDVGDIDCPSLAWSAISGAAQPVDLAPLGCTVSVGDDTAPITSGTMAVDSALDRYGNGTVGIQVDIPPTTFGDIQVEVDAMKATVTFGDVACGGCSGGINPVI